ncbi:GcrA family cell cycle regulator [Stappia sp. ES.058]|uniref:GcrA family cell cycle regulator n=1 Tax=Stappia sp. ES.058 TaxID=1881061 RepID=UPI00087BBB77|nr:GcrA family cell cycle regulator [Stappia sp. ES.058]SDT90262.1 GcrA cell cycle regulator [Stappia sp. ES.058]
MAWTTEREDLLRKLWLQGLSASQIAYVMAGVTRNAVIGKAHRMGLPKRSPSTSHRPKQRVQRGQPSLACVGGKPAVRDSAPDVRSTPRYDLDLEASAFESEHSSVSSEDRVTLMTLTSKTCKWPIGDPADADFHFCSRDADNNRSYCEFHHRLAYQGIRRRRSGATQPDVKRIAPMRAIAV